MSVTEFQGSDGATRANFNARIQQVNAHIADKTVHNTTLSCTKSGTVYALTGLTATAGAVQVTFKVPTAYVVGDTVTIDGTAYTLNTIDNTALTPAAWAVGAIITGTVDVDAKTLTVNPSAPSGSLPLSGGALTGNLIYNINSDALFKERGSGYSQGLRFLDADGVTTVNCVGKNASDELCIGVGMSSGDHTKELRIAPDGSYIKTASATLPITATASSPSLRPIVILNKTDSIPTGLADNTIVFRKQS